jgi:hypothetical protein
MNLFTLVGLKALVASKAARVGAGILTFGVCLWIAECHGARRAEAADRIRLDDSVTRVSVAAAKAIDAVRAADAARDSSQAIVVAQARATAQRMTDSALAMVGRLSVVKTGTVGSITVLRSDSASQTPIGASTGSDRGLVGDTVKFASIQRQGDARVYTVPQFVVDVGQALRDALTKAQASQAQSDALVAQLQRTIADDVKAIAARDAGETALTAEVATLKSSDGRDCRILLWSCPSRKVVGVGALVIGGIGGALLGQRIEVKSK